MRDLLLLENSQRLEKLRLLQKFPNSLEICLGRWSRRLTRVDSIPVVRSRCSRINASTVVVVVVITANVSTAESNGSLKRKDEHKGRRISFDCCNRNRSEVERERFFYSSSTCFAERQPSHLGL